MSNITQDSPQDSGWQSWPDVPGLLARFLETSPVGFMAVDAGGQITIANSRAEEILRLARSRAADRIYDEPAWRITTLDGRRFPEEELPFQKVRDTGAAVEDVRHAILWPNGSRVILSINASPLTDANGAFAGMVAAIEDITSTIESGSAEASLRLFRTLLDQSTDGIEVIDPETGRFLEINERSCVSHGYSKEEFLELTVPDIDPTVDRAEFPKIMESLRQAGSMLWEGFHRRKDGTTFPVEVALHYVQLDRDYLVAVVRDVTERKQTEEALRESEERLRMTLEETQIGIWDWDITNDIWYGSPTYYTMLGYEPEDGPGDRSVWLERVHPADRDAAAEKVHDVLNGDKSKYQYEARIRHADGTYRWQAVTGHTIALDEQGKPSRMIGVRIDINEHKLLEESLQQAQKMESVGRLAGGVAHDFNNLLTVVEGYIDMALHDLPEGSRERMNLMEARYSAERAANVARQLLLFSRREPLELRPVNLNTLVINLLKMLKRLIGERYSIVSHFDNDLPVVKADVGQVEQVLTNLIVNARDAMPEGGVIEIGSEKVQVDEEYVQSHVGTCSGEFVRLFVRDEGIGMDAETISHIFEPFFSTKKTGHGTGLGLSMVYGIITQHGGWIDAGSEPGSGSVFSIYLPTAPLETAEVPAESGTRDGLQGQKEKILLVEDDESVRLLAERILSEANYHVVSAASAEEALDIFEEEDGEFRLIFSDVTLPGMNGIKLIEQLAGRKPGLRVMLASGFMENQDLYAVRDKGYCYLEKPYELTELLRQVRDLMGDR